MRLAWIVLLLGVWLFVAYREFERGDMAAAAASVAVGIALTVFRLRRAT